MLKFVDMIIPRANSLVNISFALLLRSEQKGKVEHDAALEYTKKLQKANKNTSRIKQHKWWRLHFAAVLDMISGRATTLKFAQILFANFVTEKICFSSCHFNYYLV